MNENHTCDAVGMFRFLWDKFDAKKATDDDLDYLTGATDVATTIARTVADQLFAVAMEISSERRAGREVERINGIDLPLALVNLSDEMRMAGELTFVGSEAAFEERRRAEANRKSQRAERNKHSERGGT